MKDALALVRILCTDVDGVLTRGDVPLDAEGRRGATFSVRDGLGATVALAAGLDIALVSGAGSQAFRARAQDLGIRHILDHVEDKERAIFGLLGELGLQSTQALFVGDDVNDLAAFRAVGVRVAVADAVPELLSSADWVTERRGGEGAFREVVERVLRAQGRWDRVLVELYGPAPRNGG